MPEFQAKSGNPTSISKFRSTPLWKGLLTVLNYDYSLACVVCGCETDPVILYKHPLCCFLPPSRLFASQTVYSILCHIVLAIQFIVFQFSPPKIM